MSKISMQPEQMRSNARALEALRQQHLTLMRQMRILMMNLNTVWSGAAQEALVNKFLNESQSLGALATTLEDYIEILQSAASEIESVEQQLYAKVSKLR